MTGKTALSQMIKKSTTRVNLQKSSENSTRSSTKTPVATKKLKRSQMVKQKKLLQSKNTTENRMIVLFKNKCVQLPRICFYQIFLIKNISLDFCYRKILEIKQRKMILSARISRYQKEWRHPSHNSIHWKR